MLPVHLSQMLTKEDTRIELELSFFSFPKEETSITIILYCNSNILFSDFWCLFSSMELMHHGQKE